MRKTIERYQAIRREKLHFDDTNRSLAPTDSVVVSTSLYKKFLGYCNILNTPIKDWSNQSENSLRNLIQGIESLNASPIEILIEDVISALPSIAEQLNKVKPSLSLETDAFMIQNDQKNLLNSVFTHLLRNNLDHGIEDPESRIKAGKPEAGNISIVNQFSNNIAQIIVKDDGRGLALQRLKQKALENSLLKQDQLDNPQQLAECLFMSGVSTAKELTAVSGRGVGMDAVKKYLREHQADINISLLGNPHIADEYAHFEFIISLPASMIVENKNATLSYLPSSENAS